MSETSTQRFLASLHRCEVGGDFLPRFYRRFVDTSPEVREKFRRTDFDHQVRMLRRSLELSAAAAEGEREGLSELSMRATTHDHAHLDVRPELYEQWRESLLATAAECDPEWSDEVRDAWRLVTDFMVRFMTSHY